MRRYPTEGYSPPMLKLLDRVDYVEYDQFSGANLGYFCATCVHFQHNSNSPEGFCLFLARRELYVAGKLHHAEPLIQQKVTEFRCLPSLLVRQNRQIKKRHDPHDAISRHSLKRHSISVEAASPAFAGGNGMGDSGSRSRSPRYICASDWARRVNAFERVVTRSSV